jgi:hypothetical protein
MMRLYAGHPGVHGTHGMPVRDGPKWVIKTTARTLREPVTVELWEQHLAGKRPLGVVPITDENLCWWGSIDVDQYDISLTKLIRMVEQAKLPLVPVQSKSGGLHLFLFLSEPLPAKLVQQTLKDWAAQLGLAGSEVFPKQTEVLADRGDLGNWIVMPYYGDTYGDRLKPQVGLKVKGGAMTLDEFLHVAERARMSGDELEKVISRPKGRKAKPIFEDGPPCLQHLIPPGLKDGRKRAGFHLAIYLKRRDPDNWEQALRDTNYAYFKPPLPEEEINGIIRSLEKKDYEYTCKQEPMASHCNAAMCRGRKFGITNASYFPAISGLTKLDIPEDPIWFVDLGERRVEVSTEQLQNFILFQRACMKTANNTYPVMKQSDWINIVAVAMENCQVVTVPPDVGIKGRFRESLEDFLTGLARGERREDLFDGKPWEDEERGRHYFKLSALQRFLEREWGARNAPSRGTITKLIKEFGGKNDQLGFKGGKSLNVWWVPKDAIEVVPDNLPINTLPGDPI